MKKALRRWLWLGVGAVVLALIIFNLSRSPEWRNFRWDRLWASLTQASPGWLLVSLGVVYATYLVRAIRWRFFLDPIKKASLWVLFVGQVLGFSSIYLIGRPGEFVRPAYIAKKESVPFSAMVAVWLLERIFDMVSLVLLFSLALYFVPLEATTARGESLLAKMHEGGHLMLGFTALVVGGLVMFRLRAEVLTRWVMRAGGFLPPGSQRQLAQFLRSFSSGLEVIRNWKDFAASVASTVLLWALNTSVFWWVFKSLGGRLEQLSWLAAGMVLFCAALGLVVQFPGIGGGYQVGALLALTEVFHVEVEAATSAAILVWIMVSVPCLALGLVLLLHEGLTFRKLKAIAEEERVATLEEV